jgi:hypothetical protein
MNKRCIVNVATGEFYGKMQERLVESLSQSIDYGIDLMTWSDCLPEGSRLHSESPYGFKVHAIKAAYEKGYTSILWLDSPAYAVKEDVSPIFEKIEKEGYYAMSHIDPLENWVGDTVLKYYNNVRREALVGKNLPSGSCYGFDFTSRGGSIFHGMQRAEEAGMFKSEPIGEGTWHRHDEAILAMELGSLKIFTNDPLFQSDSPECVIKSGG